MGTFIYSTSELILASFQIAATAIESHSEEARNSRIVDSKTHFVDFFGNSLALLDGGGDAMTIQVNKVDAGNCVARRFGTRDCSFGPLITCRQELRFNLTFAFANESAMISARCGDNVLLHCDRSHG